MAIKKAKASSFVILRSARPRQLPGVFEEIAMPKGRWMGMNREVFYRALAAADRKLRQLKSMRASK